MLNRFKNALYGPSGSSDDSTLDLGYGECRDSSQSAKDRSALTRSSSFREDLTRGLSSSGRFDDNNGQAHDGSSGSNDHASGGSANGITRSKSQNLRRTPTESPTTTPPKTTSPPKTTTTTTTTTSISNHTTPEKDDTLMRVHSRKSPSIRLIIERTKLMRQSTSNYGNRAYKYDLQKPEKFRYTRPEFLQLRTNDEIMVSADHKIRPIILPRDVSRLPWKSGYAECINAGKSQLNEDQAACYQDVAIRESALLDCNLSDTNIRHQIPWTYFGLFDGHAGTAVAVAAAAQLHKIISEKLRQVADLLIALELDIDEYPEMESLGSDDGDECWNSDEDKYCDWVGSQEVKEKQDDDDNSNDDDDDDDDDDCNSNKESAELAKVAAAATQQPKERSINVIPESSGDDDDDDHHDNLPPSCDTKVEINSNGIREIGDESLTAETTSTTTTTTTNVTTDSVASVAAADELEAETLNKQQQTLGSTDDSQQQEEKTEKKEDQEKDQDQNKKEEMSEEVRQENLKEERWQRRMARFNKWSVLQRTRFDTFADLPNNMAEMYRLQVSVKSLVKGALESAFWELDALIAKDKHEFKMTGGCTAIVSVFILGKLYVCNAGDSRAIVCKSDKVIPMSFDHTPISERQRINRIGLARPEFLGNNFTHLEFIRRPMRQDLGNQMLYRDAYMTGEGKRSRALATIGVTRGFGDHELVSQYGNVPIKPFLTPEPEVRIFDFEEAEDLKPEDVLIMGTDGLWDVTSNEEAAEIVKRSFELFADNEESRIKYRYITAAQDLVIHSRGQTVGWKNIWRTTDNKFASQDDISTFVVPLKPYRDEYLEWKQLRALSTPFIKNKHRNKTFKLHAEPWGG